MSADLRAAVYAAIIARGTDDYPAALQRVVDAHVLAPLIELDRAIERARKEVEQREAEQLAWYDHVLARRAPRPGSAAWDPDLKDGIALMRSTYPPLVREAAA